jgi:hypothetical protein
LNPEVVMDHDEKPQPADAPHPESLGAIRRIMGSGYYEDLQALAASVQGKVVATSRAGGSGFLLSFSDGSWVVSFLEGILRYEVGEGEPPEVALDRLNSPACGDARQPLAVDLPYSNEPCDIAAEVAKSHGRPVTGLAFGERCFNFCFPGGWELDTMIVPDPSGRTALRVFFEQW